MGKRAVQYDMFPGDTPGPEEIIEKALDYKPVAVFVGYSGGDDSLATAHWAMTNVPSCEVVHFNTGIGIEATRDHVRKVCAEFGWPLTEVRAKEDCGQDYDAYVKKWGFPGPPLHQRFYNRLKGRCAEKVVRDRKRFRSREKVLFLTGIRHDESVRRMAYGGREVNHVGSQIWANPLYWRSKSWFMDYIREHNLPRNPVSEALGMSGECLCGAFAHKGEKALVRIVCPRTADRLDRLEAEVRALGFTWGWEDGPPKAPKVKLLKAAPFMPTCQGCEKTADLFEDEAACDPAHE